MKISLQIPTVAGSPPRMRGKPTATIRQSRTGRITPADAGKTPAKTQERHAREDHPRGCGENIRASAAETWTTGSPPRMRGKPVVRVRKRSVNRITPADAGKTAGKSVYECTAEDHPRGCGENPVHRLSPSPWGGSPPRMRGKRTLRLPLCLPPRITPADAGKTPGQGAVSPRG